MRLFLYASLGHENAAMLQIAILTALLTGLTLQPIIWFLVRGWAWRRQLITRSLTPAAKDEYLSVFQRQPSDVQTAQQRFEAFYVTWYGRRHIAVPTAFLALVTVMASWLLSVFAFAHSGAPSLLGSLLVIPSTAAAALAGAYAFTTYDMIERVTRRDLSPNDLNLGALRILVSIPLGYVVQGLAAANAGALLAFALSAFPFEAVAAGLRKIAARQLGWDKGPDNAVERVTLLAGLDLTIADRIKEADITTITQLAYSDPIQLAMRTNLGFNYVIDVVSQALAWVYFGDKLNTLRPYGLRGAFELVGLQYEMFMTPPVNAPPAQRLRPELARRLLVQASKAVGLTSTEFLNALHQVADDPYSRFLLKVYG